MIKEKISRLDNQLERSHNISLLFEAVLPDGYMIDNGTLTEHDSEYKKFFNFYPPDLLKAHDDLYGDILTDFFKNKEDK